MTKVVVLGGDGFVGWPTALHLSSQGFDVAIVDNLARRKTDVELGISLMADLPPLSARVQTWKEISGKQIKIFTIDVASEFERLCICLSELQPDAVCHFAQQRSAPFSMLSSQTKRYTVNTNVNATNNVLLAMIDICPNAHLVHMGTMGVYGYGTSKGPLPEGYLDVQVDGVSRRIVHPYHPGSVYHATKCLDNVLFHFFAKNNGLRITDLHQGIIWGTDTTLTASHPNLRNRIDLDGEYGTVLNRFAAQLALQQPMSVYGSGGQTRAFIHISDSARCTEAALKNPPERFSEVQMYNQVTQCLSVKEIALMMTKVCEISKVKFCDNPRKEAADNDLDVVGTVDHPGKMAQHVSNASKVLVTEETLKALVAEVKTLVRGKEESVLANLKSKARW